MCVRERERERKGERGKARDRELHPIALGSNPLEREAGEKGRERERG